MTQMKRSRLYIFKSTTTSKQAGRQVLALYGRQRTQWRSQQGGPIIPFLGKLFRPPTFLNQILVQTPEIIFICITTQYLPGSFRKTVSYKKNFRISKIQIIRHTISCISHNISVKLMGMDIMESSKAVIMSNLIALGDFVIFMPF